MTKKKIAPKKIENKKRTKKHQNFEDALKRGVSFFVDSHPLRSSLAARAEKMGYRRMHCLPSNGAVSCLIFGKFQGKPCFFYEASTTGLMLQYLPDSDCFTEPVELLDRLWPQKKKSETNDETTIKINGFVAMLAGSGCTPDHALDVACSIFSPQKTVS